MQNSSTSSQIPWQEIEENLNTLTLVEGGFSQAKRGIITLPSKRSVFIKIGVDDNTKRWIKKEIAVYRYLKSCQYSEIPELLSFNQDETALALEPLLKTEGWDWTENWTKERLFATLKSMDDLALLKPQEGWAPVGELALDESRDGWKLLAQSPELQETLRKKIEEANRSDLDKVMNISEELKRSTQFKFRTDTLVHYDVRADNCAWNAQKNQVKFVDWNWTQLGDQRVDFAAMLTHVERAGLDVARLCPERLDSSALHWMAGFWLHAAANPIWPGGPEHLRDFQFEAGVTAFVLSKTVN